LLSALDRGKATATETSPYTKLKEGGNAIDLGGCSWLKCAGILGILHKVEQLALNALARLKLDGALSMNLNEIVIESQKCTRALHLLAFLL